MSLLTASCSKLEIGGQASDPNPITSQRNVNPVQMLHTAFSVATHGTGPARAEQRLLITDSSFVEPRSEFRIEIDAVAGFDADSLSLGSAEVFRTGMEGAAAATLRLSGGRLIFESPALFGCELGWHSELRG